MGLRDPLKPSEVTLTGVHLDGLSSLATHSFQPDRLDMFTADSAFHVIASHRLPFGRWLNVLGEARPNKRGFPVVRLKIGSASFSPDSSRSLVELGRWGLELLDVEIPELDDLVRNFDIEGENVVFTARLQNKTGLLDRFFGSQSGLDSSRIASLYCELFELQTNDPTDDFAVHVRRAFAHADPEHVTPQSNQESFVALAMAVVNAKVGLLAGVNDGHLVCEGSPISTQLHGRRDLPKHWAMSAALKVTSNARFAKSLGEYKELADSLSKNSEFALGDPSGFSFIDIAANRAGILIAERAASSLEAVLLASRLARARQDTLLPPSLLKLKEGRSIKFAEDYGTLDDERFKEILHDIDTVLNEESLVGAEN